MCSYVCIYQQYVIIVPTAPRDFDYIDPIDRNNNDGTFNVTLTWRRPDPPNGLITKYNVSDITNNHYH